MFEDMRRCLQYMQWQHFPGLRRPWVLKTPSLIGTEASFASVFRGADFIITHRHPQESMASVCALFCGVLRTFNDHVDKQMAGQVMLANFGETVKRHVQWRDGYPVDKVMDLRFDDIVKREFEVMQRIYDFIGQPFTDSAKSHVREWLAMDSARHSPSRRYALAEFGLDTQRVNSAFFAYIQRYAEWI
jgi:hypothetical protein